MNLILCLDNKNGMMFNHRRQSRDSKVIADILDSLNGNKLFINEYSKILFESSDCSIIHSLGEVGKDDFYFCEDNPITEILSSANTLTVYRWNRTYPSDVQLDMDLSVFELVSVSEFEGSSHHITKEVYKIQ